MKTLNVAEDGYGLVDGKIVIEKQSSLEEVKRLAVEMGYAPWAGADGTGTWAVHSPPMSSHEERTSIFQIGGPFDD